MTNWIRNLCAGLLLSFAMTAAPGEAAAEIITLMDNTRLHGRLVHYFDGEITLQTADGARVKIPSAKVKAVRFKLPKPRAAFSTPKKTFLLWKQTLLQGKIEKHIECYAMMYQMMMTNLMGAMSKDELEKMLAGHRKTRYQVSGVRRKGKNLAFLKVAARMPGAAKPQVGELLFVRENGEWKMVPPQFQRPMGGQ